MNVTASLWAMAKGKMQPQSLPPTAGAAAQHSLRVYLQWHDWALMKSMSLAPFSYGWQESESGGYEPVGTLDEIAPPAVLNLTTCNCNISNPETACKNDTCQCRRLGLKCLTACGKCHGTDCTNGKVDTVVNDEDSDVELED